MHPNCFNAHLSRFQIIERIVQKYKVKAFLVGGAVRDCLLARPCTDFDFAVEKDAIKIAKTFAQKIKGAFVILDAEHHCARVARKEQGKLFTFDFADFRAKGLKGDLSHRDFTINAMCVDLRTLASSKSLEQNLIDPFNGQRDLKRKKIKMTSTKAFAQDPLRLVRGFSLEALLGFTIDPTTLKQMKKDRELLNQSARERVRDEFFKILSSDNAFNVLKKMDRVHILEHAIPQVTSMFYLRQAGGYHHLSLWAHSLETVRQIEKIFREFSSHEEIWFYLKESLAFDRSRLSLLKLAALFHDIGKPQTCRRERGKISFHGHEHVGRYMIRDIAKFLKLSTRERFALEMWTLYHLRPGYLSNFKKPTPRAIFRYFRDTKEEAVGILLLSLADQRSTRGPLTTQKDLDHHEKIIHDLIKMYYDQPQEAKPLRLITGDDLIKTLKLTPGPLFKKMLSSVEEAQALGKIKTKKQALELARKVMRK